MDPRNESPSDFNTDLTALRNLIEQIDLLLAVPNGGGLAACRETTKAALALVAHLSETPAAAQLASWAGA